MSEFEAHSVKVSHLLSEVGVPPTLPYQSSHSCITCPSGLPTTPVKEEFDGHVFKKFEHKDGLCDGMRFTVRRMENNVLKCKISTGGKQGETMFIPRITLIDESTKGFSLKRLVSSAISFLYEKSFELVGIDLRGEIFGHGQLFVALSRVKSMEWNESEIVF
ncbi:uncharacterized protein LOC142332466 [Lycorma delicatula]|uniref:uncharacterized protein LOC142332466 n=1 Tax=Lycorma delicatula TaxID=130591 RepID=UPI003F5155AB